MSAKRIRRKLGERLYRHKLPSAAVLEARVKILSEKAKSR